MVERRYSRTSVSLKRYFVECKQSYFDRGYKINICWKVQLRKRGIRKEDVLKQFIGTRIWWTRFTNIIVKSIFRMFSCLSKLL